MTPSVAFGSVFGGARRLPPKMKNIDIENKKITINVIEGML